MSHDPATWERNLALGREGERVVALALLARGVWVRATSIGLGPHDRAPRIAVAGDTLPAPDFLVEDGRGRAWVEVKSASYYSRHRKSGRIEHGIGEDCWRSLVRIDRQDAPVALALVLLPPGGQPVAQIGWIRSLIQEGSVRASHEKIFVDTRSPAWSAL